MSQEELTDPFNNVEPQDAVEAVKSGDVRVVDVREQFEWDRGHIAGATLIPLNSTAQQSGSLGSPRS